MQNNIEDTFGDEVIERIADNNEEAIVLEPRSTFNRAIIGSDTDNRVVYLSLIHISEPTRPY